MSGRHGRNGPTAPDRSGARVRSDGCRFCGFVIVRSPSLELALARESFMLFSALY